MAWSYRKRIKIAPGVHLNFSKRGVSTSIGPKGAKISFGKNGTYLNTSIPGTGLYSRTKLFSNSASTPRSFFMGSKSQRMPSSGNGALILLAFIFLIIGIVFMILS